MHFPDGGPGGKRVPESGLGTGRAFRLSPSAETASRNKRSNWDALSKRPASGKHIPFRGWIPGRSFRMRRRSKQKAPARDGAGAKGAAYAVDVEREQLVSNGCPRPTLAAVADAAVGRIHHGQIGTQLAVKCAIGVLHGGRRGDRCDLADALAAICHRQ